ALLPSFRLSKERGGRIPTAVCNRRATPERRKSGATRRARTLWAVWGRCFLLTGHFGHARRPRLAIQPKELSRDMAEYFNRLLTRDGLGVADRARESREDSVDRRRPVAIWRPMELAGRACRLRKRTSIHRCI